MRRSLHSFVRHVLCLVIASVATTTLPQAARAQGTMGLLPEPMSTREMDGYAKRLSLSPQQRRALDALHDQYKQEMRALREGEIAEFLKKMREMEGGTMPQRKQVEDFLARMDGLSRKIAVIDNRVFDQLQTSLTEEQLSMLPRARQARTRARMNNMQMLWMGGQRPVDLSEIVLDIDLTADERQAADPILSQYESKLTSDMSKSQDSQFRRILDMFEALEALGISEEEMQNPENAEKVSAAMQEIWQEVMAKTTERVAAMGEMNDRTYQSIAAAITPANARTLRTAYYRRAYPEATFALSAADYLFDPALKRDDLTEEQRATLTTVRDDLRRRLDAVADEFIARTKEYRKSFSPFEYDAEQAQEFQKSQTELMAKADEARASADAALEAGLGKDLHEKIGRIKPAAEEPQVADADETMAAAGVAAAVQIETPDEADQDMQTVWGIDQFVPAAISEGELADYSERLALTDEQRTVLRDLHQRYTESFQSLGQQEFARLQKATSTLWSYDEATQTSTSPSEAAISDTYRLRAAALEAVRKADDAFFAEMELAVLTPEQVKAFPRVKAARERMVYNRGSHYWGGGGSNEASIDLSRLVLRRRTALPADHWNTIDAELLKYEPSLGSLLRERYAKSLEAQKVQELWSAEITRAQAAGETNNIKLGMRYQEMMKEPQRALADASAALATLNRTTVGTLISLLPSDAGSTLRNEYNRRAFPGVYSDAAAVEKHIERARALAGLTDDQTRRLADLAAEYHPAYAALCDQMAKASEGSERQYMMAMDETSVEDWQRREETLARLRFDRSELNARAAVTLRDVLSEDQLKSIGGLPKAEDEDDFGW